MFMVLSSWQSHCESSPDSFDECRTAPSGGDARACQKTLAGGGVYRHPKTSNRFVHVIDVLKLQ